MLGNGEGKQRATRNALPRPRLRWNLIYFSSGEDSMAKIMEEAGKAIHSGQEVRMIEVPAYAGWYMGIFEDLHGHENGDIFAVHIDAITAREYGSPGRAWIEYLTANAGELKARIRNAIEALKYQLLPEDSESQFVEYVVLCTRGRGR